MDERRKTERADIASPAVAFFGESRSVLSCAALDLSSKGGKIALPRPYALPKRFLLSFDNFDTARNCRLIWSRGNFAGVQFVKAT